MRTEQKFMQAMTSIEFSISVSRKPQWIVPTETGYLISCIKPKPSDLPRYTCAVEYNLDESGNLYDLDSVAASDESENYSTLEQSI